MKDWNDNIKTTWVCPCETWNLISFIMEKKKAPQITLWDAIHSHHENNEKGVFLFILKVNYKCIKSTWKLKDDDTQPNV